MQFCLGCSFKLNIFDKRSKLIFDTLQKYNFYKHISLTYPHTAFFINFYVKNKNKVIAKILGENKNLFKSTINKTLSRFGLKNIYIVQLTNLPLKNLNLPRTIENLDKDKYNDLLKEIKNYKKNKIIRDVFLQIYYSDNKKFILKIIKDFDGLVISANPNKLYLKKEIYKIIKLFKKPLIQLSCFGSVDKKKLKIIDQEAWLKKCLTFPNIIFNNKVIQVGRTKKNDRLKKINNFYNKKIILKKKIKLKFINNNIFQQSSEKYLKDIKYNSIAYEFIELIKYFVKLIVDDNKK